MKRLILMRTVVLSAAVLALLGCVPQVKVPDNLKQDPKLPAVANVMSMGDRTAIGLEWEGIDDPSVVGYIIYRGDPGAKLARVGATTNRFANHYLDAKNIEQGRQYAYSVSYFTKDGRESARSATIAASSLPAPEPISWLASGNILPRKAKILFRPHSNERICGYEIERRDKKGGEWKIVGELDGRLHAEYIDEKLGDGAQYEYRIVSVSFDRLKSRPSDPIVTATRPLPPTVSGVSASAKQIGKIDIKWRRLADDRLGTYRIYASGSPDGGFSQIAELKPTSSATEKIEERGVVRYYKVSFVDPDGLESPLQTKPAKGGTLPPPPPPADKSKK